MYGAKYLRAALPEPTGLQPAPDRQAGGQGATIQKYIRLARPLPAPGQNGSTFVRNHAQLVWAYDFLPVIDLFFRQIYAFFIIELASPRAVQFGFTSAQPTPGGHGNFAKLRPLAKRRVFSFAIGTARTATICTSCQGKLQRSPEDALSRPEGQWGLRTVPGQCAGEKASIPC